MLDSTSKTILIAEDHEYVLQPIVLLLQKKGYQVVTAANGKDAFQMISQENLSPDLLVTDINMPVMGGLELIKKIKEDASFQFPILVMTGHGDKELLVELIRAGCNEYIDKPFKTSELVARISTIFEKNPIQNASEFAESFSLDDLEPEENITVLKEELKYYQERLLDFQADFAQARSAYDHIFKISDQTKFSFHYRQKMFRELGGDLVDILETEKGVNIFVADVAGHDIGASYQTVMIKAIYEEKKRESRDGYQFFEILNSILVQTNREQRLVTGMLLEVNLEDQNAYLLSAAHPALIRIHPELEYPELISSTGGVIGLFADSKYTPKDFHLMGGEILLLMTDGILNCCKVKGESGEKIKLRERGLIEIIQRHRGANVTDFVNSVWEDVLSFCDQKATDDMLLLGIQIP